MGLLTDTLLKQINSLSAKDLKGVKTIGPDIFAYNNNLTSVELSDDITEIGVSSFTQCPLLESFTFGKGVQHIMTPFDGSNSSLVNINSDNLNPYCGISPFLTIAPFSNTPWYLNHPANSYITMAKGKILVGNKISKPSQGFIIPESVVNLAAFSCARYGNSVDSAFTSINIPDTVEMIQGDAFENQTSLTKIIFGTGVNKITGTIVPSTAIKTLIFKQPAGMEISLPTPGESQGMFYNKDTYSVSIYTDNEYIQNYGWATDNVTATFYPLSKAPL